MPTPTTAFADVAAEFGNVDPDDLDAVQRWFLEELPKLSQETLEQALGELLRQDGTPETRSLTPRYPSRAPLPSLSSSPAALGPFLTEGPRSVWRRLVSLFRRR